MKRFRNKDSKLPINRRIVYWCTLPVLLVGIGISAALTAVLSPPIQSFLNEQFEANLRLASKLGIDICENHFTQLLEMRLEDHPGINAAFKTEALQQIRDIEKQMPSIHMMVLEGEQTIKMVNTEFDATSWRPPSDAGISDLILKASLESTAVLMHARYFPFWDWRIISFVKHSNYHAPVLAARRIIYLSAAGLLTAVFITLLLVFYFSIQKPLKQLIVAIQNVSEGKLLQVKPIKKNEIGQLTFFFNSMVDSLKQKSKEVGELVDQLRAIFEATPDPLVVYDFKGHPQYLNPAFTNVFGWTLEELQGARVPFVPESEKKKTAEKIREIFRTGKPVRMQTRRFTRQGDTLDIMLSAAIIKGANQKPSGMVVNLTDVSEQRKLEARFQQAQKMESIGRLAGGVAHDFNNMLSVILGRTELAIEQTPHSHPLYGDLVEIDKAARRSADLTKQLLAFARRQTAEPKVLDLNNIIAGMLKMIRRLIGEDIDLIWHPGPNLWPVKIDPAQIDQIMANLCVNARDAIAGVGRITIETRNTILDEAYCADHTGMTPGCYVMMAVGDDGRGMSAETIENLFEPFYTTKKVGEGTGLGLATVYGIVKQNNGSIDVCSEAGKGTCFNIYFPRAEATARRERASDVESVTGGSETILLVEDEISILELGRTVLQRYGYTVLAARTPSKAVDIAQHHEGPIHILITDVIMPEMNGKTLKRRIRQIHPRIKVLFMSGYTSNIIVHQGILESNVHFIQKPFSVKPFIGKVRSVLDAQ